MKMGIYKKLRAKFQIYISGRESTLIGKQRLAVYLYASYILLGIIPLLILAANGAGTLFTEINIILWAITLIFLLLYSFKKIALTPAINILAVIAQCEISIEIIYCAIVPYEYSINLILTDVFLSAIVVLLAVTAYLKYTPYFLSLICIGAYTFDMIILDNTFMQDFYVVFLFSFFIFCLLGNRMIKNTHRLEQENLKLKNDEQELLWTLRMNKEQVKAFIELTKHRNSHKTGELLEIIDERSRHNIISSVSEYQKQEKAQIANMKLLFPELTPSEQEICSLILQDKKQSEICLTLNKTESNINSQRAHIRKKLGLKSIDNLSSALKNRFKNDK